MEDPVMKIQRYLLAALLPAALLMAASCAPSLCTELRRGVDDSVLLPMVIQDPRIYEGRRVLWAGVIVKTTPRQGETVIEILEKPRGGDCRPENGDATGGRFLAVHQRFLDPAIYARGREITVVGTITGTQVRTIGELEYSYPVLSLTNHILWPYKKRSFDYFYPRAYPAYPYYPFYDPFYRPLWNP
jgi:outer membrane lipoprotein